MKSFRKIMILLACVLLFACMFTACGENTKQDKIATDLEQEVSSNGGLAVRYGKYLYFINGYVGSDALNTFGDVKTGAVCRVEMKDGAPDYSTFAVVVPKNVYGTDTTYPGIYIVKDYIYYHTTSVDKDSDREYKTDEGVLMRTKVDGTDSKVIKEFDDNATIFYVAGDYIVIEIDDKLTAIAVDGLEEKTVAEEVKDYKFIGDYLVYTTANADNKHNASSDYLMYVFDFTTGNTQKVLASSDVTGDSGALATFTFTDVKENGTAVYVFYTVDDNTLNGQYDGYWFTSVTKADKKVTTKRITNQTTTASFSDFYLLENGFLGYNDGALSFFTADGTAVKDNDYEKITTIKDMVNIYETATEIYAVYTTEEEVDDTTCAALNYLKLYNKGDSLTVAKENKVAFCYFDADSSYTKYEIFAADNMLVFLDNQKGDIAAFCKYDMSKNAEESFAENKVLGKIDNDELIDLISSGKIEEEE